MDASNKNGKQIKLIERKKNVVGIQIAVAWKWYNIEHINICYTLCTIIITNNIDSYTHTFIEQHVEMSFWIVFILSCWLLININKTNQNKQERWEGEVASELTHLLAWCHKICNVTWTMCNAFNAIKLFGLNARKLLHTHLSLLSCVFFSHPFSCSSRFLIVFCIVNHTHCFKTVNFGKQIILIWLKQSYDVISDGKLWRLWLPASCEQQLLHTYVYKMEEHSIQLHNRRDLGAWCAVRSTSVIVIHILCVLYMYLSICIRKLYKQHVPMLMKEKHNGNEVIN